MKNKLLILMAIVSFFFVFGVLSNANADIINISPVTEWGEHYDVNTPAGYLAELAELTDVDLILFYKADTEDDQMNAYVSTKEEGLYSSSYNTTFYGPDPSDATISWESDSGFISGDPLYLVVKDGIKGGTYIFDLTYLISGVVVFPNDGEAWEPTSGNPYSWNGTDTLQLSNFWADKQGGISHVAIYGGASNPVPEPATMLLFGSGLLGLAAVGRKKFRK